MTPTIAVNLQNLPEYLSVTQVADVTGMSQAYWWKQLRQRAIPYTKLGSAVRIRKSVLTEWLATREVAA